MNDNPIGPQSQSLNPETVVRILKHENPYLMVDRATVQDERLSWEARGLLVYLLSLPPNWDIRVRHLQKQGGAGRDAVRRILRELQEFGYASGVGRESQERRESGRFGQTDIRVYESPSLNPFYSEEETPSPENTSTVDSPVTGSPSPETPSPENTSTYKGNSPQREQKTKITPTQRHLRAAGAPAVVVGADSKFSLEDCRKYADHLHSSGQGVTNPGGFARTIHKSGAEDSQIAAWLAEIDPERVRSGELPAPARMDASSCPDCEGRGWFYADPANSRKGVKKCRHPRLTQVA